MPAAHLKMRLQTSQRTQAAFEAVILENKAWCVGSLPRNSDRHLARNTANPGVLSFRPDVLIHAKEILRVIPLLDLRQPLVILPVRRPDAFLALVHHEIDVRTAR